jgi:hypothetical protein
MQQAISVGIDSGVQSVALVIDLNHRLVAAT